MLIGAVIAAVMLAESEFVTGLRQHGLSTSDVLDITQVQVGVQQILTDPAGGYGANTVTGVDCNNGNKPIAAKGTTFTCTATVNGAERHVTIVVSDDHGTYEIDAPR